MEKVRVVIFIAVFLSVAITGASFAKDAGKEVGSTVSQTAHDAKSAGLKGQDLAEKVHGAIDTRKEQKDALKAAEKGTTHKHEKAPKQNFGTKDTKAKGKK